MSYTADTAVTVYQTPSVLEIKLLEVEFVPDNKALKMWWT